MSAETTKHSTSHHPKPPTLPRTGRRTTAGTSRLELRIAPQDKQLFERAARASRVTTTAFVLEATRQAAEDVLRREQVTVVPADFYEAMIASLDVPAERNKPLAEAARRRRAIIERK
ncbi:DUF1778 domain-containing protein [Yinghuangia sp. ASG 101]|uniref:type II toxin-antitoxin system TacA family antitoxin n=1 Tax=Yinghuangia sp. ASG 101 TaxID=2896848 RepID=UPI001E3D5550|nr:DUF1778 domain-containing protein [Yinghuangia sp. ASG 101]UGQ10847.1 DUF1778 domain-containing protein [Yinghuangia sp. ASG 101]